MRRMVLILGTVISLNLACTSTTTIAVANLRDAPILLRIVSGGASRAWRVSPGAAGLGPTYPAADRPFVVLATLQCDELARFAPEGGGHTITLVPDLAASINDAIDDGLGPLVEVDDPCPF